MTGAETLQRLTALQSSRLLQLVAECKRLAGLAGIRDYSVPGLDAPPAVVTERWRAEMPKFEPITEQWRYAFAPEKVIADYKRANAELDAAEAESRELREKVADLEARMDVVLGAGPSTALAVRVFDRNRELEARIRELTEWRPMETAPVGKAIRLKHVVGAECVGEVMSRELVDFYGGGTGRGSVMTNSSSVGRWTFAAFVGWLPTLPLPSTEGGEG